MLAIIPARGGSRRIPGKNKKYFHGKPIIAYSIMAAQDSGLFDRVVVTTDDPEIYVIAEAYGAVCIGRPAEMCQDDVGTQDVAKWVLSNYPFYEYACVIYPCAPMIDEKEFRLGFKCLSTYPYAYSVDENDCDAGQWYWGHVGAFMENIPLTEAALITVPNAIDINTPEDWKKAEKMYSILHGEAA